MVFKKSCNRFLSLFLSIVILICPFFVSNLDTIVFARTKVEESESQRDALEAKGKELREKLDSLKDDISHQEEYRNTLESQIEVLRNQIIEIDEQIKQLGAKIPELENSICELQADIKGNYERLKKRLAAIYKAGDIPVVDIILGSKNFNDFIDKVRLARDVSDHDFSLISGMKEALAELKSKQTELESARSKIEEDKIALNSKRSELAECVKESDRLIEKLGGERKTVLDDLDKNDKELMEINDRIADYFARQAEVQSHSSEVTTDKSDLSSSSSESKSKLDESDSSFSTESSTDSSSSLSSTPSRKASVDKDFLWPLKSCFRTITSPFGDTEGRMWPHTGVDIAGAGISGSPVYAARGGEIIDCESGGWGGGYGTYAIIAHKNGFLTLYAHMSNLCVSKGQTVEQGQQIGNVGSTGHSSAPHLHFEVRKGARNYQDPMNYSYSY